MAVIFLAVVSLVDDCHRLRSERLKARASSAKGAAAWLGAQARQGWQTTRARAAQLGTRLRLVFGSAGSGRVRRSPSASNVAGGAAAGGGAGAGYGPLPGGGGSASDERSDGGGSSIPNLPSRLREVLVAGSLGSSVADLEGASPPPSARQPLLGPAGGSASSRGSLDRSPQR